MVFNVSIKFIVRVCFYLIIIGVCVTSWIKLLQEPTYFEEKVVYNQARLPSFTLCPSGTIRNTPIESFEDIERAIENVRYKYTIEYKQYIPYEQTKWIENKYNDSSYGTWYFAPKIDIDPPFDTVICLIWTPLKEYKIKSDWSIEVSQFFKLLSHMICRFWYGILFQYVIYTGSSRLMRISLLRISL